MNPRFLFLILCVCLLITGCGKSSNSNPQGDTSSTVEMAVGTATLPAPGVRVTPAPDVENAVKAYMDAWQKEDYASMYGMLTNISKDAISLEDFTARYTNLANEMSLNKVSYQILSTLVNPKNAQVAYKIVLSGILVGDVERTTRMVLSLENGGWRIQWDEAILLPELAGGNKLWMDYRIPARGNIYDSDGEVLVSYRDAIALGIDTSKVGPDYEYGILEAAWYALDQRPDLAPSTLQPLLQNYRDYGYYLGLGEARPNVAYSGFVSYDGSVVTEFSGRYYEFTGVAPHAIGYISSIHPEETDEFRRKGYSIDQKVGRSGIELWGESSLAGKSGATLYVMNPEGKVTTKVASNEGETSSAVYTTFREKYQLGAQRTLNGFRGALVVLERDTGRILAMASSPSFDPNSFEPTNYNSNYLLSQMNANEYTPLVNRATMGQYPLGSVFKIITTAAALESGLYTKETPYDCGYDFTELPGLTLHDWTWEHVQRGDDTPPSGHLTLWEGLMRSCNPFFWHIGLDLFREGHTKDIAEMSRGFGLSKPTGVIGLDSTEEEGGQIVDPGSEVDAVNNAIGQGQTQVTPIQVAMFAAAVGNGGTLYRPQLIEKIVNENGEATYTFKPEEIGKLPVKPENLKIIQDAMLEVTQNKRGTAWRSFIGTVPVAGKTGTAQDPPRDPHAWFAGYTIANNPKKPDIAAAVLVENQGEGSEYAAPIFRALVDLYFKGGRNTFHWESSIGVLATPTPAVPPAPPPE